MSGYGQIPFDDNGRRVLALWNDATGQVVPVHIGSTVVGADGKTYAVLDINVKNGNPNGQATMANSAPVVLASDQMIDIGLVNAIRNGKGYQASTGRLSSATNSNVIMGMGIFNNSTAKNILIYSIRLALSANQNTNQLNLTTVDPAFGNVVTPRNISGSATASVASVSAPSNNLAISVTEVGSLIDFIMLLNNTTYDFLGPGQAILLPANAPNGVALYTTQAAAGNGYSATMKWIEY